MEVKQEVRLILNEEDKREFEKLDLMLQHFLEKCSYISCDDFADCDVCPYGKFIRQVNEMRQTIYKWRG